MRLPIKSRLALSILLAFSAFAQAESLAPVTSVVLYPGSATVERTAHIAAGATRFELTGLPANFDLQTLRVQADAGIQLGQVVTKDQARSETLNENEADLEAKIQALKDRVADLDVEANAAMTVKNYLDRLGGGAPDRPQADAKAMVAIIDTIRHSAGDSYARIQKVAVQKRDLDKKIAALESDLARVRSNSRDARSITVSLRAEQAGTLRLSYQVNGAGWKPTYRAMLDTPASTVALERMATVSQKTGEDWSGVRLKLSTGQPRQSPQAPEPRPWLLSYQPPRPVLGETLAYARAVAPAPAPAPVMMTGMSLKKNASRDEDGYIAPLLENQGNYATEFEVPAKVSLPSDGREVTVALAKLALPVRQRVRIAPRIDSNAVLTAEAQRPEGIWLPGNIQLFRDGSYVGATRWNIQDAETLMLPFGRDDLMRVTVDRSKEQSGTAGFISQHGERKVADVYTVSSFHKTPVDILLLESSPVSTSDEVKVMATFSPQPGTEAWDKRRGVVAWERSLAPNETAKFNVAYTIAYPKEGYVNGLP